MREEWKKYFIELKPEEELAWLRAAVDEYFEPCHCCGGLPFRGHATVCSVGLWKLKKAALASETGSPPMKRSDLLDRWTILVMKSRLDDSAKKEFESYGPIVEHMMFELKFEGTMCLLQLMEANAKIWILEASIRQECDNDSASKDKLTMEEVGRRAIQIREWNSLRVGAKQKLDELFGEPPDKKIDHVSEGKKC